MCSTSSVKVEHDAPSGEQCSTYIDVGNLMPSHSVHGVHGSKTMNHHVHVVQRSKSHEPPCQAS